MYRLWPRAKTIVFSSGETADHTGFFDGSKSGISASLPDARSYSKPIDFFEPSPSSLPAAAAPWPRRCCGPSSPSWSCAVVVATGFFLRPGMSASFGTSISSCSAVSLLMNFKDLIGRCCESIGTSVADASCAASLALSNSGAFRLAAAAFGAPDLGEPDGSTMKYRLPSRVSYEYQKRSLNSSQCGVTWVSKMSLLILG